MPVPPFHTAGISQQVYMLTAGIKNVQHKPDKLGY